MKVLNIKIGRRSAQSGFTIIELVVVILLLGILTATALPRFMDVTDEAHTAVIAAVAGGLGTGMALFHAQWIGEGQGTTNIGYGAGTSDASTEGYPIGFTDDDAVLNDSNDCVEVFDGVLQAGRPVATVGAQAGVATVQGDITGAAAYNTSDFIAIWDDGDPDDSICEFFYVAQKISAATIPVIIYDHNDGSVVIGSSGLVFP